MARSETKTLTSTSARPIRPSSGGFGRRYRIPYFRIWERDSSVKKFVALTASSPSFSNSMTRNPVPPNMFMAASPQDRPPTSQTWCEQPFAKPKVGGSSNAQKLLEQTIPSSLWKPADPLVNAPPTSSRYHLRSFAEVDFALRHHPPLPAYVSAQGSPSGKCWACTRLWWRRRESNPRPKMSLVKSLHA